MVRVSILHSKQWIIDNRALHHMTPNFHTLTSVYKLDEPIYITILDGRTVSMELAGTVNVASGLILKNVLYTPNLTCNLISAHKLVKDENCLVTYGANSCLI